MNIQIGRASFIPTQNIVCLAFDYRHVRIACTQTRGKGHSKLYGASQLMNMYVEVYFSAESSKTVPQLKACGSERHNLYRRTIATLYRDSHICLCPWSQWNYKSKWRV